MKYRFCGTAVKGVAFFLFMISFLTAFWSVLGVGYMVNGDYYRTGFSFLNTELCDRVSRVYANEVFYNYFRLTQKSALKPEEAALLQYFQTKFSGDKTNFLFTITDKNGNEVLSNDDTQRTELRRMYLFTGDAGPDSKYALSYKVRDPLIASDDYTQPNQIYKTFYQLRYALIALASISSLLTLGLFVYLIYASGRRKNTSQIVVTWQHRIPIDVFGATLVFAGFIAAKVLVTFNLPGNSSYGFLSMVPVSFILLLFSFMALAFCMNFAVQVKRGKWWRRAALYRILKFAAKTIKILFRYLPMIWKASVLIAGYLFVNGVLTAVVFWHGPSSVRFLVWLLFNCVVFAALCRGVTQMKTLKRAGEKIAAGDYDSTIDTKSLVWDFRQHAESLNNIVSGMSRAVEARLKSERLKTELITNVSHDLKTPLTSIINYVDLLKKEPLGSDAAEEYIAVLDRQSLRLKKLTEDLLEASKAATGNISINLGRTDLVELLNQSLGEYAERFEAERLEIVFKAGSDKEEIYADGRLLWRIFDNLLNNIIKYTLPGTRVYILSGSDNDRTTVTLLNISRDPLNAAPDELTERFVRGDTSRSTDGSGLGLSIAKSLTELQGGSFELQLEGDLFKTVLTFKTLP